MAALSRYAPRARRPTRWTRQAEGRPSASSWPSSASTTKAARLPSTRNRGPGVAATDEAQRWLRTPVMSRGREDVVVGRRRRGGCRPRRRRARPGRKAPGPGRPDGCRGRAAPRRPHGRAVVSRQASRRSCGRQRSNRDSYRLMSRQGALRDQPAKRQLIGVPAAVVEDGQGHARPARRVRPARARPRLVGASGLSTTTASPASIAASRARRASRWASRSRPGRAHPARSQTDSARGSTLRPGCSARACEARLRFRVTTVASADLRRCGDQRAVEEGAGKAEADQRRAKLSHAAALDRGAGARESARLAAKPGRGVDRHAASSTAPVIMNLMSESSASRSMPLEIEPITIAPEQRRPDEAAAAEQAGAGDHRAGDREQQHVSPLPDCWLTASSRDAARMPPNAARVEASVKTADLAPG